MGPGRVAYLVVLNGKQDEALRVLAENGLIKLLGAECGSLDRRVLHLDDILCGGMLCIDILGEGGNIRILEVILLVGETKIKLLDWGVHLQGVNARSSLLGRLSAHFAIQCLVNNMGSCSPAWKE